MKSVSVTLADAQWIKTGYRTPYIHLTIYSGETPVGRFSFDGPNGNLIKLIDYFEEAYNDYATIVLSAYDRTIFTDYIGCWVELGFGDTTEGGNEYSLCPPLWVKHQQVVSMGSRCVVILELEGLWAHFRETLLRLGDPPYYGSSYSEDTIYTLLGTVLSETWMHQHSFFTFDALGDQDDDIINSYTPSFDINTMQPFEDAASSIYRLIGMTKCMLTIRGPSLGGHAKIIYPQASDDVDITYYSEYGYWEEHPAFHEFHGRSSLVLPNRVILFSNAGEDGMWTSIITSQADNTAYQASYATIPGIYLAPEITNQDDSDKRAAAILARLQLEAEYGSLVVPHDCRIEMFDHIAVYDTRGYSSGNYYEKFRASALRHTYRPGSYRLEITLGGITGTSDVVRQSVIIQPTKTIEKPVAIEAVPEKTAAELTTVLQDTGLKETPEADNKPSLWQRLTPWDESKGETFGSEVAERWRSLTPWKEEKGETFGSELAERARALTPWNEEAGETLGSEIKERAESVKGTAKKIWKGLFG